MGPAETLSIGCCLPDGQIVTNEQIDSWELKSSRRALLNLKTLLYGQPMLDLLQEQIHDADVFFKKLVVESHGQYKESRIDLKAKGFKSKYFMKWQKAMANDLTTAESRQRFFLTNVAPAHPEHYALPANTTGIIETIGEHIARIRIHNDFKIPDFVLAYADASFISIPVIGSLDDGTVLFYVLHELRDTEDGCDLILRLLFPAAAPRVLFDEHAQHLAIEFRSFVMAAFEKYHQLSD